MQFQEPTGTERVAGTKVTGLDLSNDGRFLAVSVQTSGSARQGPCIYIYDTASAATVARLAEGSGRDVVFEPTGDVLALVQHEERGVELLRLPTDGSPPTRLASYGGREAVQGLVRNHDASRVAVLGTAAEVWDIARSEVVRFREAATEGRVVNACFDRAGDRLFVAGLRDGEVVKWDLVSDTLGGTVPIPSPDAGRQVAVSPDDRVLLVVGGWMTGVHLYESDTGRPVADAIFGPTMLAVPAAFGPDSNSVVQRSLRFVVESFDGRTRAEGPEAPKGEVSAVAAAWDAGVRAFAVRQTVAWFGVGP